MPTLLRIDCSSRTNGSQSSALADEAEAQWQQTHPNGKVIRRHVGAEPPSVLSEDAITGFYTPADQMTDRLRNATATSDTLIAELQGADTLLIAVPIYNFSIPAALKCWIDQVTRIGHTFSYEDGAFQGLTRTRRAIVICAYGADGYLPNQPFAQANFLAPYLQFLLNFLGIDEVSFITLQATTADEQTVVANRMTAQADLAALAL